MSISVKLKLYCDNNTRFKRVPVSKCSTSLKAFLNEMSKQRDTAYIKDGCVVSVNGELMVDDIELKDGDEIILMPMICGG